MEPLRSAVPDCPWPGLPTGAPAVVAALLAQLEHTQWWSAERLREAQLAPLRALCAHAAAHAPWWRKRLRRLGVAPDAMTWEAWARLPLLTRDDLQQHLQAMTAPAPPAHGQAVRKTTSGSSGRQVVVHRTELAGLFWNAITLRDLLWHRRDLSAPFAAIRYVHDLSRAQPPDGERLPSWGSPAADLFHTGPAAILDLRADTGIQAAWVRRQRPAYLTSHPSNLRGLLHALGPEADRLGLRQVLSYGEMLSPALREELERGFGAPVCDVYSTQEVGNIALQCPDHPHLHVQAEDVLVEVLREDGTACGPGEIGRVVVTPLHNFATALLRYDLGDYAEVGPPCACGRGLPVLTRVHGRVRNLLTRPDGTRIWPFFMSGEFTELAPIRQFQFRQRVPGRLLCRLVVERPLTSAEEAAIAAMVVSRLGAALVVDFEYPAAIERSAGGKYEDFINELPGGAGAA